MPHKCTACGRQFADGSKEMLSGCPDCGGTKFQFMPSGGAPAAEEPPEPPSREAGAVAETVGTATAKLRDFVGDDPDPPSPGTGDGPDPSRPGTSDGPASGDGPGGGTADDGPAGRDRPADATEGPPATSGTRADALPEDGAQSAARSEFADPSDLPAGGPHGVGVSGGAGADGVAALDQSESVDGEPEGEIVDTPSAQQPDLSELREELNDQFEGIRICEPGQYELNLMELYEREETIIALQENGRYVIEPPESWHGDQ